MPLYYDIAVENADDVDSITKMKIHGIVGDHDEEAKWHRLTMFAMVVQAAPHMATPREIISARKISEKARDMYFKIEAIVEEGRRFKGENRYD